MEKQLSMTVLGVLALCFLIGLTAGCLCSLWAGEAADEAIHELLTGIAGETAQAGNLPSAFLSQFQYPIVSFLLGLTILGVFLIPATVIARGFFLAFTVTSCIRVFGAWKGFVFSLSMLGPPTLITLPCLLVLATFGGVSSLSLFRNALAGGRKPIGSPLFSKESLARLGICTCAMTAAALLEAYICPILVNTALRL